MAIVLRSEFGVAVAVPSATDTPNVGVGNVEPDDADVVAYWTAERRFEKLPAPSEGEWLAEFEEPGQTVDAYFASGPNAVTVYRKTLYIQPIGDLPPGMATQVRQYVAIYFGMPAVVLPRIDPPSDRLRHSESGTPQWHTGDLHHLLFETSPPDAYATLGITMTDLYPGEDWEYVFGHARFKERVAVISGFRYGDSDGVSFRERILRVATHELGHAFGILHCVHFECAMNGVNSLEESDLTPLQLCPVDLRKIQTAVGFHPRERYERLEEFYRTNQMFWQAERVAGLIESAENPMVAAGVADAGDAAQLH